MNQHRTNSTLTYFKQLVSVSLLIGLFAMCSTDRRHTITSPDNSISVDVWLNDSGDIYYSVTRSGRAVVNPSQLGIITEEEDLSSALELVKAGEIQIYEDRYDMVQGKKLERHYTARQQQFDFTGEKGDTLSVLFRVSNDGVGFQYRLPEQDVNRVRVEEEYTFFALPSESTAWLTPMAVVNTGWSETNPSYEEYYEIGIDVGSPSPLGVGWSYPALFQTTEDDWLLITESGMDGQYPGTRLLTESEDGLYRVGFPADEEVITGGIRGPEFVTPWRSPWRVLAIGGLDTIVESTLGTDLAYTTLYDNTSYIEAGRASWSWAKLKDDSVNYDRQVEFINYASEMGWEYTLVDVNWDQNIGYERIAELADYAEQRGVGLWLWYNSSGDWNTSPYTPKSALLTHEDRVEEFSRLQQMGIRGIKIDFFPGDGQSSLQYYIDIFEDAHDHELMVNTHGSTLPRGWHRTYPNLMTMESVRGFEYKTFEQANQNETASHATVLPFTRNVFDPMDYTPMSLDEIPGVDRITTSTHELAHTILFLSGVQHFAETYEGINSVPEAVKNVVKKIPAAWDDTRFIDGYPGESVIIARKKGDRWFIAGINGEEVEKTINIQLPFLDQQRDGLLLKDSVQQFEINIEDVSVSSSDQTEITMKPNGGFVMVLE